MSIEQTVERLTEAVNVLASAVAVLAMNVVGKQTFVAVPDGSRPAGEIIPPAAVAPTAPLGVVAAATPPRPRGRPPGSTKEAAAAAQAPTPVVTAAATPVAAPVEADPFGGEAAIDEPALTEGNVRVALQALRDRKGRTTEVFKLLKDIGGVDTLPKLEQKFYARIIIAANAIV